MKPLFFILAAMAILQPTTAFVPVDLRGEVTNDVSLYTLSMQHQGEAWAQGNIEYLVHAHTNRIRVNELSLKELENKMNYILTEKAKRDDPYYCDDCFEVTS